MLRYTTLSDKRGSKNLRPISVEAKFSLAMSAYFRGAVRANEYRREHMVATASGRPKQSMQSSPFWSETLGACDRWHN